MELTQAYGRNQKTAKAVTADFNNDLDFEGDYSVGFALLNKAQLKEGQTVYLRFNSNRGVARVNVTFRHHATVVVKPVIAEKKVLIAAQISRK
jgi:hypothetical protein